MALSFWNFRHIRNHNKKMFTSFIAAAFVVPYFFTIQIRLWPKKNLYDHQKQSKHVENRNFAKNNSKNTAQGNNNNNCKFLLLLLLFINLCFLLIWPIWVDSRLSAAVTKRLRAYTDTEAHTYTTTHTFPASSCICVCMYLVVYNFEKICAVQDRKEILKANSGRGRQIYDKVAKVFPVDFLKHL